jgi:hypothetical protein
MRIGDGSTVRRTSAHGGSPVRRTRQGGIETNVRMATVSPAAGSRPAGGIEASMRVGVKYCGGCRSGYDRVRELALTEEAVRTRELALDEAVREAQRKAAVPECGRKGSPPRPPGQHTPDPRPTDQHTTGPRPPGQHTPDPRPTGQHTPDPRPPGQRTPDPRPTDQHATGQRPTNKHPSAEFVPAEEGGRYDVLLVVCGCRTACPSLRPYTFGKVVFLTEAGGYARAAAELTQEDL